VVVQRVKHYTTATTILSTWTQMKLVNRDFMYIRPQLDSSDRSPQSLSVSQT